MPNRLTAKLLAEFIGTFAFVFIGAAIAFAHGLTIMVFAFAYASLSGAHFNPAVTVGVLAARVMARSLSPARQRRPSSASCHCSSCLALCLSGQYWEKIGKEYPGCAVRSVHNYHKRRSRTLRYNHSAGL